MKHLALLLAGIAIFSATLEAQASSSGVPDSHRPPPGMCRIWIDGVPPAHQPAPTDCATAIRKRPMNARVVFGNDAPAANGRGIAPAHGDPPNFVVPSAPTVPSRDQQDRDARAQREAQARESQERARIEAQRLHDEEQKRDASRRPPEHVEQHAAPRPPPRIERSSSPPRQSSSSRRPR